MRPFLLYELTYKKSVPTGSSSAAMLNIEDPVMQCH